MIRFAKIIGEIYNLGNPKLTLSQAQHDIMNFLGVKSCGMYYGRHWNIPKKYDASERTLKNSFLIDHIDKFKYDITLLPYIKDDSVLLDIEEIFRSDVRMKLCMKYGLKYTIGRPHSRIFEDPYFAKRTALIILHCDNWMELRKNICAELNREYRLEWKQKEAKWNSVLEWRN